MGKLHHHPEGPGGEHHHGDLRVSERRRLIWVMLLTAVTMVAEFVGGMLTGSVALMSDAVHMLTHLLAVGISYFAILIALRPAAAERTYKNWRAEILGSLFSGIALIPLAAYVIYEAVERFLNPAHIQVEWMLVVAAVGLVVNVVSAMILHAHSKEDINVRGAFLHMVADTASSVGVIAAGGALMIWGDAVLWVDPLAAGLISLLILVWAVQQIRKSCSILLEAVPPHVKLEELEASMRETEGVAGVHDLHVWTITSGMHLMTAHVRLERNMLISETDAVTERLQRMLREKYRINHPVFQFEVSDEPGNCDHSHNPSG